MKNLPQSLLIGLVVILTATSCANRKGVTELSKLSFQQRAQFDQLYFKASKQKVLGNYPEAARLFADALKIDPRSHATMYQLANLNMAVSGFHDAVYWAEKSMLDNPVYNYWYAGQLAQAYSKVGEFRKSAQVFEVMAENEPERPTNYQEASRQYINAQEFKKAIKLLEVYVDRFGIDEEAARMIEGLYFELGKSKDGISWMQKLTDSDPDNVRYIGLLAESYVRDRQNDKAKMLYLRILKMEPDNGYGHFGLSDIYKRQKQEDSSFYHLTKGFDDVIIPIETKIKVVGSFFPYLRSNDKMRDRALVLTKKLITVHDKEDKAYLVRSDVLHVLGEQEDARKLIITASELNPGNIGIWKKLLGIDDELGNYAWLVDDSKEALSYFPNQPFLYIINSFANYSTYKYEQAISMAEEGLEIALLPSDRIDLLVTIADASYELGQYEKTYETYDEVLELDPKNDGAMNNYAYYLSEQQVRLNDALVMIDKALLINPNRPTYLDTKGWVLFQLERYSEALPILEKAYSHFIKDKEVANHYADCLEKLGKNGDAQKVRDALNKTN
ncbi:MAG: tetratricopeptide (TPR) repeat protein [Bacteroidia bacterium]|jgi:tetratricopeptide (TPR) repeat protein